MSREPTTGTATVRARYDRLAPMYDAMQWFTERRAFRQWRTDLWSRIAAGRILEVGVGTGRNIGFYPAGALVTAVDLSPRMLERALKTARELGRDIDLRVMDAQQLEFPAGTFDTAVATFVFCSVPDPGRGLGELGRVVKPGGDIWLLEHVRVDGSISGPLMDAVNPLAVRLMGANINRRTVENVRRAGLEIASVEHPGGALVKLIRARPAALSPTQANES